MSNLLDDIAAWETYYRQNLLNQNGTPIAQHSDSETVAAERSAFLAGRASVTPETTVSLPSLLELIPVVEAVSSEHSLTSPTLLSEWYGCSCDPILLLSSEEEWRHHFAMELLSNIEPESSVDLLLEKENKP